MNKRITVGSNAFFTGMELFSPHDEDILILEDSPKDYKVQLQIHVKSKCIFMWKRMTPQEYIEYHKIVNAGIYLGKFLVPEFVEEIGFTIDDLKELEFLVDRLDERHQYERSIYYFYISNNGFFLTEEQRKEAFEIYIKERK